MKTEKRLEQPISSDEAVNPEDAVAQPTSRRVGYKTVQSAVVIGIFTMTALWLLVIRQAPDVQATAKNAVKKLSFRAQKQANT